LLHPAQFAYAAPTLSLIAPTTGNTGGLYNMTLTGTNVSACCYAALPEPFCFDVSDSAVVVSLHRVLCDCSRLHCIHLNSAICLLRATLGESLTHARLVVVRAQFGLTATVSIGGANCPVLQRDGTHTHLVRLSSFLLLSCFRFAPACSFNLLTDSFGRFVFLLI
jgi:hypothetical protein